MADIIYQPADALTFVGSRCAQFECALEQHENGQLENENILGWLQNLCALKYSDEDILEFLHVGAFVSCHISKSFATKVCIKIQCAK